MSNDLHTSNFRQKFLGSVVKLGLAPILAIITEGKCVVNGKPILRVVADGKSGQKSGGKTKYVEVMLHLKKYTSFITNNGFAYNVMLS